MMLEHRNNRFLASGNSRCEERFLVSCAITLLVSSFIKLIGLAGGAGVNLLKDPLLGIELRWLMPLECALEVSCAVCIVTPIAMRFRLLAIAWLGTMFLVYHLFLSLLQPNAPCPCLGSLLWRLGVSPQITDYASRLISCYFLLVSVSLLCRRKLLSSSRRMKA